MTIRRTARFLARHCGKTNRRFHSGDISHIRTVIQLDIHDYFSCELSESELRSYSALALAHIGDAVYEIMARTFLALSGESTNSRLHSDTVSIVSAKAQSAAAKKILPILTDEEKSVYMRGRNAHGHAAPKHTGTGEYHAATGLETLFGYLYLAGRRDRLNYLFDKILEDGNGV